MGSSSKPFDIYEVPDSDLEKPLATKANRPSMRTKRANLQTRMKTRANSMRDPSQSEHKTGPGRKSKQSELKKRWKGLELAKPRRSARLEAKRQKTS